MACATEVEVVVVGGGPGGLAAAIAARQQGFEVVVVEALEPPIDKACGEGLMPDSLLALHQLGIDLSPQDGAVFQGIRFVDGPRAVEANFPHGIGVGVRRLLLHAKMIARAEALGIRLFWNAPARGIGPNEVRCDRITFKTDWIVAADGLNSLVRGWAGLGRLTSDKRRLGMRQHFKVAQWSPFVEVHWGEHAQCYVTPVGEQEVCVAILAGDSGLRYDHLPRLFPAVWQHLREAEPASSVRGSLTASRRVRSVYKGRVALLGDASGAVDAITGEGLCLAFRQALSLAAAMRAGNLRAYASDHRHIEKIPHRMASTMLLMDGHDGLRRRAMAAFAARPEYFAKLLAFHVGAINVFDFGWRMPLSFGYDFLVN